MFVLKLLLIVVAGYLLGSFSMSIVLSRETMGADVREKGSGNAGATNMARVYGWKAGFLTLAGDMLKAGLAVLLGWLLLGDWGLAAGGLLAPPLATISAKRRRLANRLRTRLASSLAVNGLVRYESAPLS